MTNKLAQLREQLEEAQRQKETQEHRLERLSRREKYARKAEDRRRTHRLIQYGVAFEANDKRLAELTTTEIFTLVELILEIPEVKARLDEAVRNHTLDIGGDV